MNSITYSYRIPRQRKLSAYDEDDGPEHVEDDTQAVQVGPEPDATRDSTQHHHIPLCGTREGPWAAQEASPCSRRWSDSELGCEERGIVVFP